MKTDFFKSKDKSKIKFKGFTWTMIRNVPSYGLFFAVNSYLTEQLESEMTQSAALLLAGGLTGLVSWTVAFPSDTLKSKIQADNPEKRLYSNSASVLIQTLKNEGHSVLWKGLGPCLLRSMPVCAILFTVQAKCSDFLKNFQ